MTFLDPDSYFYDYGSELNVNVDSKLGGLDIELMQAIARSLDFTFDPYIPENRVLEELKNGDALATLNNPLSLELHQVSSQV